MSSIVALAGGQAAPPYGPARRPKVSGVLPGGSAEGPAKGPALSAGVISQGFSELLGRSQKRRRRFESTAVRNLVERDLHPIWILKTHILVAPWSENSRVDQGGSVG